MFDFQTSKIEYTANVNPEMSHHCNRAHGEVKGQSPQLLCIVRNDRRWWAVLILPGKLKVEWFYL